jgi:YVTN family beta-propeller protein
MGVGDVRVRVTAVAVLALVAWLTPGMTPAQAAPVRNERLYVANSGSDTVSVIDGDTYAVVATIPVGDRPTGVLAVGSKVYVTNELSATVSVIDVATNAVIATVPVGLRPAGLDVDAYGREVWVANEGSNSVSVISAATNSVLETVPVGVAPHGIAFSFHGEQVYVTSQADTVSVIDVYDRDLAATVPVGHTPTAIVAPFSAEAKVYVANQSSRTVSVIDRASNEVVKTIAVGIDPTSIVEHYPGRLLVANTGSDTISVIATTTDTVVDTWPAVRPYGLAGSLFTPDRLFATGMGATGGIVSVIDATTGGVVTTVPVGDFPQGIGVAAVPPPVISGQTWYSTGTKALSGPAGSTVSLYAVGALQGVPYQLTLSWPSDWPCLHRVAILNPTAVMAGPNGLIGRVRGTIPPGTPAGTYTICFRHTAGATATGVVSFTVA